MRDRHACAAVWWRRSLARSLDHAHAERGGGDGGGGGGRLHRASFVSCASHVPFVSRACAALSPRVINVSLPSSPSRAIGTHALRRRWRSLVRSIARAVWRWRWRWRSVTTRVNHVTRITLSMHYSHTRRVIAAHHARHRRFPSPPRSARALRRWRRSLALYRARGLAVAMAVGYAVRDARPRHAHPHHALRVSRSRVRTSPPRVVRVINVSLSPARNRHARAAAAAALARSLDRAHAVWR